MRTGLLWQGIYWLSTPTLAASAIALFLRRLHRRFPLFFAYILVAFLGDIARLVAYHSSFKAYNSTYWFSELVNTVFSLLATYELFLGRLFPRFQRTGFYRALFSAALVVVITLSILTGLESIRVEVLFRILHGLDFLRVTVLMFFVGLMVFMGRRWERYEFGIALGFGVQAAAFLSAFAIWTTRKGFLGAFAANLPVFSNDLSSLIWFFTFLKVQKSTPAPTVPIQPEILQQAREWEETLKGSLTGKKPPQ